MQPPIEVRRLGVVPYADALELQKRLVELRKAGTIPDQLLLLEHPPVITLGVKARSDRSHVVATPEALEHEGVEIFESGRGGDVTYHGPGQLVGYPILDLRPDRCDVHRYVRDLEDTLIRAVAAFGINAHRIPGLTGAWGQFVTGHVSGGGTGSALYGVCYPVTKRGYTGIQKAQWLAELAAFAKGVGFTGPIYGYDLADSGIQGSAYVSFTHVQGKCVIPDVNQR